MKKKATKVTAKAKSQFFQKATIPAIPRPRLAAAT